MAQKNIRYVKKAIFNKLKEDTQLTKLLGGEKIYYLTPPQKALYPSIIYDIATETENPFRENEDTGKITEITFGIHIFSDSSSSRQSDDIEARVKELLNGKGKLSNTEIIDFGCHKQYVSQRYDNENALWITNVVYLTVLANK